MFETKRFLVENFGSTQGLLAFLRAYGVAAPNDSTVGKWFSRASVPSEWLPLLLGYLEIDRGQPVSLIAYIGRH